MTNSLQNNDESVIFNGQKGQNSAEIRGERAGQVSSSSGAPRKGYIKRTPETDDMFFDLLSASYPVSYAAQAAGYTRQVVYEWRAGDKAFMERWKLAKRLSLEAVEEELMRRIFDGTEEPVFQKGALVGHRRKYSDRILIEWLKQGRKWVNWLD